MPVHAADDIRHNSLRRLRCSGSCAGGREIVDIVEYGPDYTIGARHGASDTISEAADRRLLSVCQKKPKRDGLSRRNPARQFPAIGMTRVIVRPTDACSHTDFIALNADRRGTILKNAPECPGCLIAGQQKRRLLLPKPALQMVTDAARIAHAAPRHDDLETADIPDGPALIFGFREPQKRRL